MGRTRMRKGPVGWFIECQCCAREFESKGWAYCPTCMELSADQRRANHPAASDRPCQRPGCPHISPRTDTPQNAIALRKARARSNV